MYAGKDPFENTIMIKSLGDRTRSTLTIQKTVSIKIIKIFHTSEINFTIFFYFRTGITIKRVIKVFNDIFTSVNLHSHLWLEENFVSTE